MKFTKILALLMVALMSLTFFGCSKKDVDYIIYSDSGFAPFEFKDKKTGEFVGIDVEIFDAIAKDQGFTYKIEYVGFDTALGNVKSGKGNGMIAGMTINDTRKKDFDFSNGYFADGSIFVVAADSDIDSYDDLKGKVVAAKSGTVSKEYTDSIKDKYGFEVQTFKDSAKMYQAVVNGNAVACFEDYSVINYAINNQGVKLKTVGEKVNNSDYGFAVKKGTNKELIKKFNDGLENIKKDGTYDKILAKYGTVNK